MKQKRNIILHVVEKVLETQNTLQGVHGDIASFKVIAELRSTKARRLKFWHTTEWVKCC